MKIQKQVYELTADDLVTSPIWKFALDEEGEEGQDEATVRPYKTVGPLDPSNGMYVIRAAFTLADGSKMSGYLTPPVQGDESLGTLQPVIVTGGKQVALWFGIVAPNREQLAQIYQALDKNPARVFPLRFASEVPLVDGPISGTVPGFLYYEDDQLETTA